MNAENNFILKQCEDIIQEGLDNLYKIDKALSVIKDFKLYGEQYHDFDEYCSKKWGLDKSNLILTEQKKRQQKII